MKHNSWRIVVAGLLIGVMISLVGCDFYGKETNHPILKKANTLRDEGKFEEAIEYYKKYLIAKPKSTQTHLKLAVIYDENLNEPLLAIYHYKEYLQLNPEAKDLDTVKNWLKLCETRFLEEKQTGANLMPSDTARTKIPVSEEKIDEVAKTIENTPEAKVIEGEKTEAATNPVAVAEKVEAEAVISSAPEVVKKEDELQVQVVPETKTENSSEFPALSDTPPKIEVVKKIEKIESYPKEYLVRKGDTLSHISMKFYGSSRYYQKIMDFNNIKKPSELKAGRIILIPKIGD